MNTSQLVKFEQALEQHLNVRVAPTSYRRFPAVVKGLNINQLEAVKTLRKTYAPNLRLRYWFRGPRRKNMSGDLCASTLKQDAHSFDIYLR